MNIIEFFKREWKDLLQIYLMMLVGTMIMNSIFGRPLISIWQLVGLALLAPVVRMLVLTLIELWRK